MIIDKNYLKKLIYQVNGAAIRVHKEIGPGMLEKIYHKCLIHELQLSSISFKTEMRVPVVYKDLEIECDLFCDLFIEDLLVVELKSVAAILPIHEAQLLTYMNLLHVPIGLIINFNCQNIFHNGQKTYVNELYSLLP